MGLKRFCSELISTLKSTTTSESREPETGREAKRLCFTSPADTAGLEPATSHYADIVVNAAGALPFKSYASCDSFPDYRLAESRQGRTDALY